MLPRSISWLLMVASIATATADEIAPIARRLPPAGVELSAEDSTRLARQLADLRREYDQAVAAQGAGNADVEVYLKAVDLALRHGEFYRPTDVAVADQLLATARQRLAEWNRGQTPWTRQRGLVVRGYFSALDGSAQPYGLEIPADYDFDQPAPLYVWLHGRGDQTTDLHFIHQRQTRKGQIAPPGSIVLHPFGRHCVGFKHAGEIDVLDTMTEVQRDYGTDPDRIVLMGFSMGGAGAWHIGAHYSSHFIAVSPGAGFAETARYNGLSPEAYPAWYEQALWGLYDVPHYTRNLFNLPVVAYSGELDKQIQAARVMEESFQDHGRTLPHVIGAGMGHKYDDASLEELLDRLQEATAADLPSPNRLWLQTQTLRYAQVKWLQLLMLEQHWQDTRVDAEFSNGQLRLSTVNVGAVRLKPPFLKGKSRYPLMIDRQILIVTLGANGEVDLVKREGSWRQWHDWKDELQTGDPLYKRPHLQGPIDDAFLSPFLVVLPSKKSVHSTVQRWVEFEQRHFLDRWSALMRGDPRVKLDYQVTDEDVRRFHLILWGDVTSNQLIARVLGPLPLQWTDAQLQVGSQTFAAERHVPLLVYPNPLNPNRYVVFNSGLTFREAHDRTNSLQNPKLPDWAVIDLSRDPDELSPGTVIAAGFFDEAWQVK